MEELGAVAPPSHSWLAPLVEDMLHDVSFGLTKAVVTGQCRAVLFYGRHSLEEGLTTDEARDATFLLTGEGTWDGKPPYLTTDHHDNSRRPMSNHQGHNVLLHKGNRAGHPWVKPLTQQPFRFDHPRGSLIKGTPIGGGSDHQSLPCWPPKGQDCNRCQRDQRLSLPQLPSPSPDRGFESNRSSLSTALSLLSMSDRSEGSQHSKGGRQH